MVKATYLVLQAVFRRQVIMVMGHASGRRHMVIVSILNILYFIPMSFISGYVSISKYFFQPIAAGRI